MTRKQEIKKIEREIVQAEHEASVLAERVNKLRDRLAHLKEAKQDEDE